MRSLAIDSGIRIAGDDDPLHPGNLEGSPAIDSERRIAGEDQQVKIVGTVIGLTTQPKRYGRPTLVKLAASGAAKVQIDASFDRTGDLPLDRITIDCPALRIPGQTLGDDRLLAFDLAPSTARVEAELTLAGDQLNGVLLLAQSEVALTPHATERLGGGGTANNPPGSQAEPLPRPSGNGALNRLGVGSKVLAATLADIHDITTTVRLTGTLGKPTWTLESNLGDALAAGIRNAWRKKLEHRRDELIAKFQRELDRELAKLTEQLDARRGELVASLNAEQTGLARFVAGATSRAGLPVQSLGRGLDGLIPR